MKKDWKNEFKLFIAPTKLKIFLMIALVFILQFLRSYQFSCWDFSGELILNNCGALGRFVEGVNSFFFNLYYFPLWFLFADFLMAKLSLISPSTANFFN